MQSYLHLRQGRQSGRRPLWFNLPQSLPQHGAGDHRDSQSGRNSTLQSLQRNFLGSIAIMMWGVLPLLRLMAGEIPPLQLTSMSLLMASLVTYVLHRHFSRKQGKLVLSTRSHKYSDITSPIAGSLLGSEATLENPKFETRSTKVLYLLHATVSSAGNAFPLASCASHANGVTTKGSEM